jgi:hypothetical protein
MFYEKLKITVDIARLQQDVEKHVFALGDPVFQGDEYGYDNFGGWSLLTRSGNWQDGWEVGHTGHPAEHIVSPGGQPNYPVHKFLNLSHSFEHANPTEGCQGYIAEVMDVINGQGFYPRRARVSLLRPGGTTLLHQDAVGSVYMARIHIPLWTNQQCIHHCDSVDLHMPADGSVYILWVNRLHQVHNRSEQNRYHIIMDAYDTEHQTEHFRYLDNINLLQHQADQYRHQLDQTQLSPDQIQYFTTLQQQYLKT